VSEQPLPVNHHADHPGFSGLTGSLFAWLFLLMGRDTARLATELSGVGPADTVVDIGCGAGNAVRAAARAGAQAIGIDPSESMLRVARTATRATDTVTWAKGGAESIPLPDGTATVVWALATVHHWPDVDTGVAELRRVLAQGGRLLVLERQAQPGDTGFASHGWTAQQAESFAALCRSAGLTDVRTTEHRAGRRDLWAVSGSRAPASGPTAPASPRTPDATP
jgi:ubiquinone/menaquinone biosynthesis C-methylase UbiE